MIAVGSDPFDEINFATGDDEWQIGGGVETSGAEWRRESPFPRTYIFSRQRKADSSSHDFSSAYPVPGYELHASTNPSYAGTC